MINHVNIISLSNKINDFRELILELSLDYLLLSKTKIKQNIPTRQFYIKGYKVTARWDRDKHDDGLIEFFKNGFISKNWTKNAGLRKVIIFVQCLPSR